MKKLNDITGDRIDGGDSRRSEELSWTELAGRPDLWPTHARSGGY